MAIVASEKKVLLAFGSGACLDIRFKIFTFTFLNLLRGYSLHLNCARLPFRHSHRRPTTNRTQSEHSLHFIMQ